MLHGHGTTTTPRTPLKKQPEDLAGVKALGFLDVASLVPYLGVALGGSLHLRMDAARILAAGAGLGQHLGAAGPHAANGEDVSIRQLVTFLLGVARGGSLRLILAV